MNSARACSSREHGAGRGVGKEAQNSKTVGMKHFHQGQETEAYANSKDLLREKTLTFQRNYRQAHCIAVRMALKLCVYNSRTSGQFSEYHQWDHLFGLQCTKQLIDWNSHCSTHHFGVVSTKSELRLWKLWVYEPTKSSIWKGFWIFGGFLTDIRKTYGL